MPKSCWDHPSGINVFTDAKDWRNLKNGTFILIFYYFNTRLSQKTSPLMRSEVLGMFCNRLTADHMNFLDNRDKFLQQVQTLLSQKPKTFSGFFFAFQKSTWTLSHFENKCQLHSSNIFEVIDPIKCCYLNARQLRFQNTFRESTFSRVPNTDELCLVALLSWFSINSRQIWVRKHLS